MSDLESVVKGLASQFGERVADSLKQEWDEIADEDKDEVEDVLRDVAALTVASMGGENVSREMAHAKAAMASWGFVGASRVRVAIKDALEESVIFIGNVLKGLVL